MAATTYNHYGIQFRVQLGMKFQIGVIGRRAICAAMLIQFSEISSRSQEAALQNPGFSGDIVWISSDNVEWDASSPM